MPKMKYFDSATSKWIELDAKNADTLGGKSPSEFANSSHTHTASDLPNGTTGGKGIVQLSSSTSSTSTTLGATASAVKSAYDKAVSVEGKMGILSNLETTNKDNLVGAVNELFTNVSSGKTQIATAITDKGITASGSDTFTVLSSKIMQIQTGYSLSEMIDAGVSVETLLELGYTKADFEEIGIYLDSTGYLSPAPIRLQQGDLMAGYYGKTTGLITGNELFAKTGLTAGTTLVSGDITWLKFSHNHKTLFVADRALKNYISWNDIQAQNLVKGKPIEIDGKYYLCRLIRGSKSNPMNGKNGEYSSLIVQFTPNDEDSHWIDSITICAETSSTNIDWVIALGVNVVDGLVSPTKSTAWSGYVYRPVLEVL